jgi:hypothetical protein
MTIRGFLSTIMLALTLAACQTVQPPGSAIVSELERMGYRLKPEGTRGATQSTSEIRTVATYECESPVCGGKGFIAFGQYISPPSLADLDAAERAGGDALRRTFGGVLGALFSNPQVSTSRAADGARAITVTGGVTPSAGEFFGSMTIVFRPDLARIVFAMSPSPAIARRFGSRQMLD